MLLNESRLVDTILPEVKRAEMNTQYWGLLRLLYFCISFDIRPSEQGVAGRNALLHF